MRSAGSVTSTCSRTSRSRWWFRHARFCSLTSQHLIYIQFQKGSCRLSKRSLSLNQANSSATNSTSSLCQSRPKSQVLQKNLTETSQKNKLLTSRRPWVTGQVQQGNQVVPITDNSYQGVKARHDSTRVQPSNNGFHPGSQPVYPEQLERVPITEPQAAGNKEAPSIEDAVLQASEAVAVAKPCIGPECNLVNHAAAVVYCKTAAVEEAALQDWEAAAVNWEADAVNQEPVQVDGESALVAPEAALGKNEAVAVNPGSFVFTSGVDMVKIEADAAKHGAVVTSFEAGRGITAVEYPLLGSNHDTALPIPSVVKAASSVGRIPRSAGTTSADDQVVLRAAKRRRSQAAYKQLQEQLQPHFSPPAWAEALVTSVNDLDSDQITRALYHVARLVRAQYTTSGALLPRPDASSNVQSQDIRSENLQSNSNMRNNVSSSNDGSSTFSAVTVVDVNTQSNGKRSRSNTANSRYNNISNISGVASCNNKSNDSSNNASHSGVEQGGIGQQCIADVNHLGSELDPGRRADSSISVVTEPDCTEGCSTCAPDIQIGKVHRHEVSCTSITAQQHGAGSSSTRTTDSVCDDGCSNGCNRDSGEDTIISTNVLGYAASAKDGSKEDSSYVRNGYDSTASLQPSHSECRFPCDTECSGQLSHEAACQTATGFPMSSVQANVRVCESESSWDATLDSTRNITRPKVQSRHIPKSTWPGSNVGQSYDCEHQPSSRVQATFHSEDSQTTLNDQPAKVDQSNLYPTAHSANIDLLNSQSSSHPTHMGHLDHHPNDSPAKIEQSCPQTTSQSAVYSNLQSTQPSSNPDRSNVHTRRRVRQFHQSSTLSTNYPTSNDQSNIPSHLIPLSSALHHIVHHHHHRFRSTAACSAIYLAAVLGITSPALVSPLLTRVEVTLPHFRPVTHAIALWSLARLECEVPRWLLGHWEAYIVDGMGKFSMRDLSMVTWAFARLQYDPGGLWMSQVFKHMCVLIEGLELDVAPGLGRGVERTEVQNVSEERNSGGLTKNGNSGGAQSVVWKWDGRGFSNGRQEGRIGGGIARQDAEQVDRWIGADHLFSSSHSNNSPDKHNCRSSMNGGASAGRASESEHVRRVEHFGEDVSECERVMSFNHSVAGSLDLNKNGELVMGESSSSRNCNVNKSGSEKAAGSMAGQAEHGMDVAGATYGGAHVVHMVGSAQTGVRTLPEREELQVSEGLQSKMHGMRNFQSWEMELTADVQTLRHSVDVCDQVLHCASRLPSRERRNITQDPANPSSTNRGAQGSNWASRNGSHCSRTSSCNSSVDGMMHTDEVEYWSKHAIATESIGSIGIPQGTKCECESTLCCCSRPSSTSDTSKASSSHHLLSPHKPLDSTPSSPHPSPPLHQDASPSPPPSPTQLFPTELQSTSYPPPPPPLAPTPSHCTLQSLAMFTWACTRLGHSPPAYFWTLFFSRTTAYLPMSCSTTLPVLAYSMTELLPRTEVLPPSWTASFLRTAHSKMNSMTLHDICSILLLLMRFCTNINLSADIIASPLSPSSPSLHSSPAPASVGIAVSMLQVVKCSEAKLHLASCQDLSILMSGFAAAGMKPTEGWLNRFWNVLRERMEDMNAQGCVAVLAASAKLALPLPDVLLQSLTQRVILIGIHTLKPMQLHHFMFALAGLGCTPPPSILRQLIWANHNHMSTYYPSALACIITAFSLWLSRPIASAGSNIQRTAQQVLASRGRQAQHPSRRPYQHQQEHACQYLDKGVKQPIVHPNAAINCTSANLHTDDTMQHENGAATARSNSFESVCPSQSTSSPGQAPDTLIASADPASVTSIPHHVLLPSSWIRFFLECFHKQLPFASPTDSIATLEALVALHIRPNQAWLQAVLQACALESEQSTDEERARLAAVITALRFGPTEQCGRTWGFAGNIDSHSAVTNVVKEAARQEAARQLRQSYQPGVKDRVGQSRSAGSIDLDGEPAGAAGYSKNNCYIEVRYMSGDGGAWDEAVDFGGDEPFLKQDLPACVASST